jgi:geranylgeranyl reductase family protein
MIHFEVLIVGAGPAGSFAAEILASRGAKVALFDGRPPGEPKACGGGVTAKALKAWPNLLNAVGRTINELDLYSPAGKKLHLQLDEPFAVYSRVAFDGYLRERARDAGAHVFAEKISARTIKRSNGVWQIKSDSDEWTGSVLVGADGANSGIAKMLAGPLSPSDMEVAFGYRAPLPANGSAPTVVAFLPRWVGYAWAFPRPDHISFGIATTQDAFEHQPLDDLLWRFMVGYYQQRNDPQDTKVNFWRDDQVRSETASIRQQLQATAERYAARIPGLAANTWDNRAVCGDDWALLGDAAGFADPVTGEGIYYALRSAELFAEAYARADLKSYEASWREDFGAELRRAAQMRRRFYGNFWGAPFTERMIEFAKGHRGVRRVLGDLVAGEQGYTDLKKKLLKSALLPALVVALFAALAPTAFAQRIRQSRDVIAAYRVCSQFQRLLSQDFDFARAFEATFTRDQKRRREIAIADGEFGTADLSRLDDATLIEAYKNEQQLLFLILPLIGTEEKRPLPPALDEIFSRGRPRTTEEFLQFASQLKQDVANLRAHMKELADHDPAFAESLRSYKANLAKPLEVPRSYRVRPITYYSKGRVLDNNEPYYQINDYAVIRERGEMRIIGIRFFSRLF